jgi:hypothetical protein
METNTPEQVDKVVTAILEVLGKPETEVQQKSLSAFHNGDYQVVKRLAATHLSDNFCKSLGYLGGALKLTPNTDTILAESARSAAEFVKDKTLQSLSTKIAEALAT